MTALSQEEISRIDRKLRPWRQGDVILDSSLALPYVADMKAPISPGALNCAKAKAAAGEPLGREIVAGRILGAVVISHTCEISRSCFVRPYVELSAIVQATEDLFQQASMQMRPAYVPIPSMAERKIVADLDVVMTVEKPVLVALQRIPGCLTPGQQRTFARALARKRDRPVFSDEFALVVERLLKHLKSKHSRNSAEGAHLRALSEIRVRSVPSQDGGTINLFFYFIRHGDPVDFESAWDFMLGKWVEKIATSHEFRLLGAVVCRLEDMTALEYVESDRFDLDQLSSREGNHGEA